MTCRGSDCLAIRYDIRAATVMERILEGSLGMAAENGVISNRATPWALKDLPPYRPVIRKLMRLSSDVTCR